MPRVVIVQRDCIKDINGFVPYLCLSPRCFSTQRQIVARLICFMHAWGYVYRQQDCSILGLGAVLIVWLGADRRRKDRGKPMLLPIGDEPNPSAPALVTRSLIAINVVVFVVISLPMMTQGIDPNQPWVMALLNTMERNSPGLGHALVDSGASLYDLWVYRFGFRAGASSWLTFLTSMFLHGDWMHLGFNMLFLWIFGDNVEARLGRMRFLTMYLLAGVGATLFFALTQGDAQTPLVGASGAISGVLGCYFIFFPHNNVKVLAWFFIFIQVVRIRARWVLGFYLVVQNLLPFLRGGGGSVAYSAHLGGFAAGVAWAYWMAGRKSLGSVHARRAQIHLVEDDASDSLRDRLLVGTVAQAFVYVQSLSSLARSRLPAADLLALVDGLTESGRFRSALMLLDEMQGCALPGAMHARIYLRAGLIYGRRLNDWPHAKPYLQKACDQQDEPRIAQEAAHVLDEVRRNGWI